jgi:hypothetical protein
MQLGQAEWQRWCPGRESYATTDTTNRCLSLVWWRECLARRREVRYIAKPTIAGALCTLICWTSPCIATDRSGRSVPQPALVRKGSCHAQQRRRRRLNLTRLVASSSAPTIRGVDQAVVTLGRGAVQCPPSAVLPVANSDDSIPVVTYPLSENLTEWDCTNADHRPVICSHTDRMLREPAERRNEANCRRPERPHLSPRRSPLP